MKKGFTLIETLIALVIASITTLVLLQSIISVSHSVAGLDRAAAMLITDSFNRAAATQALAAALPRYLNANHLFTGHENGFSGATAKPVFDTPGAARAFSVRLMGTGRGQTTLTYSEGGHSVDVVRFEGAGYKLRYTHLSLSDFYAGTPPSNTPIWPPETGFDPEPDYYRPPPHFVSVVNDLEERVWAARIDAGFALPVRAQDLESML